MRVTDRKLGGEANFVGGTALTNEQWRAQLPPIHWHRLKFASWTESHYALAYRWAATNSVGWVYFSDETYYFGDSGDAALFMLWVTESGVEDDSGTIA
jgi:hypothetical protein